MRKLIFIFLLFPLLTGTIADTAGWNATDHPVQMPTNTQVGDLILVFFNIDGAENIQIDTDVSGNNWTIELCDTSTSDINTAAIIWKIAEGSDALEINATLEVSSFISYRLSGYYAADPITVTSAIGSSTNYDPPSNTPLYGSLDYIWFVFAGTDNDPVASEAPADFTNLVTVVSDPTAGASCSGANRTYNTDGAYDPGTFTGDAEQWVCFTVIVNPSH